MNLFENNIKVFGFFYVFFFFDNFEFGVFFYIFVFVFDGKI